MLTLHSWKDLKKAKLGESFEIQDLKNRCGAVYGGVAWPDKRRGFVVVLAIVRSEEPEGWEIYLLDEFESFDIPELIRQCNVLNSKYEPDRWVGDTTNDSAEEFIREMNGDFYLSETDLTEKNPLYPYILGKLKQLLNSDHRRLFLKNSSLLNYLGEIEQGEVAELERGDFPALEALIYAVFEVLRMIEYQSVRFMQTRTDEDIPVRHDVYDDLARPGAIDPGLDYCEDDLFTR